MFAHLSLESPGNTWVRKVYLPDYRSLARVQEAHPRLFIGSLGCTQHLHICFPLLYRWFVGVQSTRRPLYSLCFLFSSIFSALGGVPTCLSSALQPGESLRSGRAFFLVWSVLPVSDQHVGASVLAAISTSSSSLGCATPVPPTLSQYYESGTP